MRAHARQRGVRGVLAAAVGILLGLSPGGVGCGSDSEQVTAPTLTSFPTPFPTSPSTSPAGKPPESGRLPAPLTVVWSGGFDGRHIVVTVRPDGSWTRSERRGGDTSGAVDEGSLAEIARLATSDELRDEAQRAATFRPSAQCADFVGVKLTMGELVVDNAAHFCGELELPTLSRITGLLSDATE